MKVKAASMIHAATSLSYEGWDIVISNLSGDEGIDLLKDNRVVTSFPASIQGLKAAIQHIEANQYSGMSLGDILSHALEQQSPEDQRKLGMQKGVYWTVRLLDKGNVVRREVIAYCEADRNTFINDFLSRLKTGESVAAYFFQYEVPDSLKSFDSPELRAALATLAKNKSSLFTIKFLRSIVRGVGLKEAKDYVEFSENNAG